MLDKSAFIVHGRDDEARRELEKCLAAMGLRVDRFEEIADRTASMPVISTVLRDAIKRADLIVVLFTPDEQAVYFDHLGNYDARDASAARWQARANVIFEAGWAFGLRQHQTVFVSVGAVTALFADVAGHHVIQLDLPDGKEQLRRRLEHVLFGGKRRFALAPDWVRNDVSGDFTRVVRRRWRYYDDISDLHAKLGNMDLDDRGANLLSEIENVIRAHPTWDWHYRTPRDLIVAIQRARSRKLADDAYWWLASVGFFRLSDIEYWGNKFEDSVDISSFAPRSVVFLEWLRERIRREAQPRPARAVSRSRR